VVVEAVFAVVWTAIVQVAGPGAVLPRLAVRLIDGFAIGLHRDVGLADGRNWRRGGDAAVSIRSAFVRFGRGEPGHGC